MLSAMPGICTADILEELEKYSFYYKKEIGMCLDRYGDNDEHAFDELKLTGSKELARIADDGAGRLAVIGQVHLDEGETVLIEKLHIA